MPRYALCPVAVVRNWPHFLHVFPPTVRRYALFGMVGGATDRGVVPWAAGNGYGEYSWTKRYGCPVCVGT